MFQNLRTHFFKLTAGTLLAAVSTVALGLQLIYTAPIASAANTTYYVDCTGGNDSNNGTSTSTAWQTPIRASTQTYGAGDSILLKRGCVWTGASGAPQSFKSTSSGSVASPITLADYGTGNLPKIDAYQDSAVALTNAQNWVVRNLDLTQHGSTPETLDAGFAPIKDTGAFLAAILFVEGKGPVGVQFCGEPCTARNVLIDAVKVHDGQWNGIYMQGGLYDDGLNTYGYVDNVIVQNSEVWNVHKNGIEASGTYTKNITYPSTNIKALNNYAHDNGGDGIVYGPTDHGLMDGNNCSYNGRLRNARLGCWTWDSHDVVIQFNEGGYNMTPNQTKGARDGGAFDLDLGAEDSIIQYSWSHDSDGEGFLLMQWPIGYGYQRGTTHNIHMRYNVGERDGNQMAGGIYIFGGPDPVVIYNNTIYYESNVRPVPDAPCYDGAVICHDTWGKAGAANGFVFNNIFVANGTVHPGTLSTLQRSDSSGSWTYDNNLWYRVEGGVHFMPGNSVFTTFAAWQASGRDPNGLNANPGFTGTLGSGPAAYHLSAGSPAIDRGRVVTQGLRGMGTRDYFGVSIPQGSAYDIGAAEFNGGGPTATPAPPTATPTRTNTPAPTNTPTAGPSPTNTSVPPTATPTRTNTPVPPTATPGGSTVMHVAELITTDSAGNPKSTFIRPEDPFWRVKIVDQSGNPVSGASVTTNTLYPSGGIWLTRTFATGTDGWAVFTGNLVTNSQTGTYTINVTNVVKTGATYNASANVISSTTFLVQ